MLATGWGRPADTAKGISSVLREVGVETITNIECMKQYPTVVNPNIICISGEGGRSTCKGDSGQQSNIKRSNNKTPLKAGHSILYKMEHFYKLESPALVLCLDVKWTCMQVIFHLNN